MKAALLTKYDENEGVAIKDVDTPAVTEGKMLVEIHEASVNPLDWKLRTGAMNPPLPMTMGGDMAGVVKEVGPGVTGFKPGDRVYGMAGIFNGATGSFAEYDLVDPHSVAPAPTSISETEAGALPLTGIMALTALTEHLKLKEGDYLLIQGGAGGIGSIAIQIAKHLGAWVAVTCTRDEFDYVKSLGADEAIDFRAQQFEEELPDMDAVYDLVGGEVYRRSYTVLKPGGTIVSTLEQPDEAMMETYHVKAIYQHFEVTTPRLERLASLVDEGAIKVHIEKIFPLDEANEAMTFQETTHPRGKVVIDVKK